MILVSLTVHEDLVVTNNLIENIQKYIPEAYLVVHVSLGAFEIHRLLSDRYDKSGKVFVNPNCYPTVWGWMFHAHLQNYAYFSSLKIPFQYVVFEASNSLYFRRGAEAKVRSYDFLADCETLEDRERREGEASRIRAFALGMDQCFPKMLEALGIEQIYCSTHEGTAFRRELFEQMMEIYDRYYLFDLNEVRYGREDLYLSTLARHFSANYSSRLTSFIRHDTPNDEALAIVKKLLAIPQESAEVVFALKPVPRLIDNPVRAFINSLPPIDS